MRKKLFWITISSEMLTKSKMEDVFEIANDLKKEIKTAAEFLKLENFLLEAWRKEIKEGRKIVDVREYFNKLKERIKTEIEKF